MSMSQKILLLDSQLNVAAHYRRALFNAAIEEYRMGEIYEYVQRAQFETGLPYHNTEHCIRVAHRCLELCAAGGWRLRHEISMVMCAALFHDFGHTGKRPDSINIDIAVEGMRNAKPVQDYYSAPSIEEIAETIRCTEFAPEGFPVAPTTYIQRVIRDADLMESMEPHCIDYVVMALAEEMGVTVEEAIPKQIEFMRGVEMHTFAGEQIWQQTLDTRIWSIERLASYRAAL